MWSFGAVGFVAHDFYTGSRPLESEARAAIFFNTELLEGSPHKIRWLNWHVLGGDVHIFLAHGDAAKLQFPLLDRRAPFPRAVHLPTFSFIGVPVGSTMMKRLMKASSIGPHR